MTDIEYRVSDLLRFSSRQQPIEFEDAFDALMADRISSAIDDKKIEVAQKMFAAKEQESDIEDALNGEDA